MKSILHRKTSVASTRLLLLGLVAALLPHQALLADEFENVSNFKECRSIEDKAERLLCYDTIADGGIFNEQQVEQAKKEAFGKKETEFDESDDRIAVTIVRIQNGSGSTQYFHTDDGAVWKKDGRGKWSLQVPFQAQIKAGMMSSFFLSTEGGKSSRVQRVR
jgi:hypothetical protein